MTHYQNENLNETANVKEGLSLLGRNIRRACVDGNDREVRIENKSQQC